jgi:hypothetical protein
MTNFFLKPLDLDEMLKEVQKISKMIAVNRYIKEKKEQRVEKLEQQNSYNTYQEKLTLQKELMILRNDFYYQMLDLGENIVTLDYMYQPLDTLSGDAFSARVMKEGSVFLFLVDGMGKGISASLSAMLMTSFVNYCIDKNPLISLELLIEETLEYVKPLLLADEIVSVEFTLIDKLFQSLKYAKFSMPATLLMQEDATIQKLKSNNPPLSRFTRSFHINDVEISKVNKLLFHSDGISENSTRFDANIYTNYLEEDFKNAFTKDDLKNSCLHKIAAQEDDLTFIMLHKMSLATSMCTSQTFSSKLEELERANDWYSVAFAKLCADSQLAYKAAIAFSELMMNAFEHGNLGISMKEKHRLLKDIDYFEFLKQRSRECSKTITVTLYKISYAKSEYVVTSIEDEGEGFDTKILSSSFKDIRSYNGRGIYLSRINTQGIHYNAQGNKVLFFTQC